MLQVAALVSLAAASLLAQAPPEQIGTNLDRYCKGCHNTKVKSGGLSLEGVDVSHIGDHPETGEKIVRKLRAGMMPPSGMPRPDAATYQSIAAGLEHLLDSAAAAKPAAVSPGVHRLNRKEYANSVRNLLGLEFDASVVLPVDDSSYGFDNIAGTLGVSPALIEAYLSAAAKISRLALGHDVAPAEKTYLTPADYSQDRHVEGLPFGSRGGMLIEHYFPADGEYTINWAPVRANAGSLFGSNRKGEKVLVTVDGVTVKTFDVDKDVPGNTHEDNHEVRIPVQAGLRSIGVTFVSSTHLPNTDLNEHFERTLLETGGNVPGFTFAPHINSVTITGPFSGKRPEHTPSRDRILVCHPAAASEEFSCAKTILSTVARRAFRRPADGRDIEELMSFYQAGRNDGDFETGIERGLQAILADPEFVYRTEEVPAGAKPGRPYRITDLELASRLSYFLWSAAPDDELLKLASQNKLHVPATLDQQVHRMLADPQTHELVTNFAGQWLQLRNLQATSPVVQIFPDFDDNLRQALRTETEMFFESIVREDHNVVDLLNADYTFLNERLAKHYGIPNIYGTQFRRVHLGPEFDVRRGLLGQGSILTVTSISDRTSPVQRGKWVLMNILGVIPPDPPPNVPPLKQSDQTANGQAVAVPVSIRKRMEEHRANPGCASCHKMMDPIGFAMENFDGIGRYRTTEFGQPINLSGNLVDGSKFQGTSELRAQLLKYSPQFVQTLTERLMTYALGRGVEYYDMPAVRQIARDAAAQNNRFSALILGIVRSQAFHMDQVSGENVANIEK